jgi:Flp pilus assembly protein TadD
MWPVCYANDALADGGGDAYVAAMTSRTIPFLAALLLAVPALAATKPKAAPKPKPVVEQPVTVEGLSAQAKAALAKGDTELALRLGQAAIVADPARPSSYVALGDIYAETGQGEFARSYYDAALAIDPAEPGALKAMAALDHTNHPVLAKP